LPPFTVGAWAHDAALTRVSVTSQTERTRDEPDRPFPSKRLSRTRTVTDDDADSDLGTTGTFDDVSSFLPPFANAENRALDLEIREKERLLEQLEGDTEDTEDRVDAMKRHLRNVEDEVRNTQSRAQARRREKETEAHMKRLSELAVARVRDDAKKMEKEELELDERVTNIETSTHFGIEKLDRYKLQLNWGQEELEQWSAASVQKDEDALALQRYQRADEARVRELNVAIEKVTAEVSKKKELLDREGTALGLSQIPASLCAHTILTLSFFISVSETQGAQLELDRAAEDFRTLHRERQDVVRQWEDVIESMKRRDVQIAEASRDFAQRRKEIRAKQALLAERTRFLDQELLNNKETDAAISEADRGMAKIREQYSGELEGQVALADETDATKNVLQRAAQELALVRVGPFPNPDTLFAHTRLTLFFFFTDGQRKRAEASVAYTEKRKTRPGSETL